MRLPEEISGTFRPRPTDSSKWTVGVVAVVGGSLDYLSAPVIAGLGARAGGAGLVRLVVPEESRPGACALVPEATFTQLVDGTETPRADVTVFGMGLGRDAMAEMIFNNVLMSGEAGRLVVDADALFILAKRQSLKPRDGQQIVLTPHEFEAARLLGCEREDVAADRLAAAKEIAARYGATVVLKGAGTLVVSRDGARVYKNATGNPFMALGGMGDLLAGVIGARWAYLKGEAFDAAAGAVWLHGAASDALVASGGDPSLVNTAASIGAIRAREDAAGCGKP